jgi:hypothetical protein
MHERTGRALIAAVALLAGCAGRGNVAGNAAGAPVRAAAAVSAPVPAVAPDPARCAGGCTLVVAIAPSVTTPIVVGPFAVTSINPGGDLELAVAADPACADVGAGWFEYSGGGVRVGDGQILCARSSAGSVTNQGFSGSRPDVSIR